MAGGAARDISAAALDRSIAAVNAANSLVANVEGLAADVAEAGAHFQVAHEAAAAAESSALRADASRQLSADKAAQAAGSAASAVTAAGNSATSAASASASATAAAMNLDQFAQGLSAHADRKDNPHAVSKSQVGLGNVSNIAPPDYPVSSAQALAIADAIANLRSSLVSSDIHDTSAAGRSVMKAADAPAIRGLLGLALGADVQAFDSDLAAIAALSTTPFGRSLLTGADPSAVRLALALGSASLLAAGVPGGVATLDPATGKLLGSQVPEFLLGALRFQGGWDASGAALGAPEAGNKGFYFIVTTAGATALPGPFGAITDWKVGDWAVSDGTFWEKIDSTDQVTSVAGLQGAIPAAALKAALVIGASDIADASAAARSLIVAASFADMRSLLGLSNVANLSPASLAAAGNAVGDALNAKADKHSPQVDIITASGTWTKPAWANSFLVFAMGGGGGGGGGRRGATGTTRGGGGGGGAGALNYELFLASDISGDFTITIGAGGSGGDPGAADNTDGATGASGGSTMIADASGSLFTAAGGGGGGGGSSAGSGGAGTAGQGISMLAVGAGGGNGNIGSGGGGVGGAISAAEVAAAGGTSGYGYNMAAGNHRAGRVSGGAVGANGTNGNPKAWARGGAGGGSGGGSGAANGSSSGGTGGTGGIPGGGGGGGGGTTNLAAAGAGGSGGSGGRGEVWIISRA